MKATIEFDDALYRRLKVQAALRGQPVKALVAEGVRRVLSEPATKAGATAYADTAHAGPENWFGALRDYAGNAKGKHDLAAVRKSIAHGRGKSSS